jgi:hypothetical protein
VSLGFFSPLIHSLVGLNHANCSYEPGYAHPVHQTFLPPELAGTTFLQDEDSVVGKTYDEAALQEWEWRNLGGKKWPGREEMLQRLEAAKGQERDPDKNRQQ